MKIHFSHWMQWSLNLISICKLVSILFAMLQQFSKPEILNPEEFSNSLVCFIEMSMCLLSFDNNLLTSFNLCTDVRELGSRDWQASWSPTECPCATVWAQVLAHCPSGLLGAPDCPRHTGAGVRQLSPHAARCFNSNLRPASFGSFFFQNCFSSSPKFKELTLLFHSPHRPVMPLVDSASQSIWEWFRKKNSVPNMSQNLFSGNVQEPEKTAFPFYNL